MYAFRTALVGAGALLAAGLSAGAAQAAPGFLNSSTSLKAGPGGQYPTITMMRRGSQIEVYGCIRGFGYCDISWQGLRGWARGSAIEVFYQSRRYPIYRYAPMIGIPFITFSIGNYWGSHYRNRPFYNDAWRWGGPRWDGPRRDRDDNNRPPRMGRPGNDGPPRMGRPDDNGPPRMGRPPRERDGREGNVTTTPRMAPPPRADVAPDGRGRGGPPMVRRGGDNQGSSPNAVSRDRQTVAPHQGGNRGNAQGRGRGDDCRGPDCPKD